MVKIEEIEDRPWERIEQHGGVERDGIPRIIHILVKNKNLTRSQEASCKSWKNTHGGWLQVLWTEGDIMDYIAKQHPRFEPMFREISMDIQRLDAFRYFVLYDYGGICTDTNFSPRAPLDEVLERGGDIILSFSPRTRSFSNTLMASVRGHALWRSVWEEMLQPKVPDWMNRGGFLNSSFRTGQGVFNSVLAKFQEPFSIFPLSTLDPDPRLRTLRMTTAHQKQPSLATTLQPYREILVLVFMSIILLTAIMFGRGVSRSVKRI
jgi:hypothetical protein